MTLHWNYLLKDALFSGLIFCVAIMVGARINVTLLAHDFPDVTEAELRALDFPKPGVYEWALLLVVVQGVLLWRAFRFLIGLRHINENTDGKHTFWHQYLHLAVWFLLVGWCDLVFLDWLLIGFLKIPFTGVEHLLSPGAIEANQSYAFHFGEHFLFYGTYLANLILPMILTGIYCLSRYVFKTGNTNKLAQMD